MVRLVLRRFPSHPVLWTAVAVSLIGTRPAAAVILVDREARNTAPPTGSLAAAWNLQGQYNAFNVTPISPHQFIGAAHTGLDANGTIVFQGGYYGISGVTPIAGTDLILFTTPGTIPHYAPLYDASANADGSEVGKLMAVFGRGTQRGEAIVAPIAPGPYATAPVLGGSLTLTAGVSAPAPTPPLPGSVRGWASGATDYVQSWGRNVVDDVIVDVKFGQLLTFSFSAGEGKIADEGGLSVGDSSGGVFIFSGGQWKLAGVNLGVDGPFSYTANGPYFSADVFDARGLYVGDATKHDLVPYDDGPIEGSSYASRIGGANLAAIRSVIGGSGALGNGPAVVPEPASMLVITGALLAFGTRRMRPS